RRPGDEPGAGRVPVVGGVDLGDGAVRVAEIQEGLGELDGAGGGHDGQGEVPPGAGRGRERALPVAAAVERHRGGGGDGWRGHASARPGGEVAGGVVGDRPGVDLRPDRRGRREGAGRAAQQGRGRPGHAGGDGRPGGGGGSGRGRDRGGDVVQA